MDQESKLKLLYKEVKNNERRTCWYIRTEEERNELLLVKMMKYAAAKCPNDNFEFLIKKLRIDPEEVARVKATSHFTNQEKLMSLFAIWRTNMKCDAAEAQRLFIRVIDLADIRPIVARLKAIQLYAKAPTI